MQTVGVVRSGGGCWRGGARPCAAPPPVTNPATSATTTTISAGPVRYSWFSAGVTLTVNVWTASGAAVSAGGVQFGYYGNYTFSAEYPGSGAYLPSTSNTTAVTV